MYIPADIYHDLDQENDESEDIWEEEEVIDINTEDEEAIEWLEKEVKHVP